MAAVVERVLHKAGVTDKLVLLPHLMQDELQAVISASPHRERLVESEVVQLVQEQLQEVVVGVGGIVSLAFRVALQQWEYVELYSENDRLLARQLEVEDYLMHIERLAGVDPDANPFEALEINMAPFNAGFPQIADPRSIGDGVTFLNRHLSSYFFRLPGTGESREPPGQQLLVRWMHNYAGVKLQATQGDEQTDELCRQLLDPALVPDAATLCKVLRKADRMLERVPDEAPAAKVAPQLHGLGLRRGWGCDVGRIRAQLHLAGEVLMAPSSDTLATFLSRLALINTAVIMSPHGFFAQHGVLGLPDTGGQVVYILDQVRALEREMRERLRTAGLPPDAARVLVITRLIPEARGTTCNQPYELIEGCESAAILRVPFRDDEGNVVQEWISRFEVYPYLERFALDVEREVLARLGHPPSLIIGNYTDGNLVATMLSRRMGCMQCAIAHALEMTKYPDASLRWRAMDADYHFSAQFLADLLAMNHADFIITSTYQEIAGRLGGHNMGQYERFRAFTLPGLVRVTQGISVFDPRFNIVSPGADEAVYFPFTQRDKRLTHFQPELDDLIWGQGESDKTAIGVISPERRHLPLLFSMARLDRVKNLAGLAEMYAASPRLQAVANLLIVGGVLNPEHTADKEEKGECARMHAALEGGLQGGAGPLRGSVRWVVAQRNRLRNGELYRVVAENHGAFVQPALYEAFGLTVVEAMTCGLPTFATNQGGPSEIIKHGVSGFQFDPYHLPLAADDMADFFERSHADPQQWDAISQAALQRIASRYTWSLYASRLLDQACLYSFWRLVTDLDRAEAKQYLTALYTLKLRPLMRAVGQPSKTSLANGSHA